MTQAAGAGGGQTEAAAAWEALLAGCAGVFTRPGFGVSAGLVTGWAACPGRRVVGVVGVVGPGGRRARDACHRLVRAGRWSLAVLRQVLTLTAAAGVVRGRRDPSGS